MDSVENSRMKDSVGDSKDSVGNSKDSVGNSRTKDSSMEGLS